MNYIMLASTLTTLAQDSPCRFIQDGQVPPGKVRVQAEKVVSGLEVPWGIAFISEDEFLVTERPGRIRLVRKGKLERKVIFSQAVPSTSEGGFLGIALDPEFSKNRAFYVYYTTKLDGQLFNRVQKFQLSRDHLSAIPGQVILDRIPAATFHDGGRIHFGPDGYLYVGTGDARQPSLSQDPKSLAGKLLRVKSDGSIPNDNPVPNSPAFILGIRNTQGFDWLDSSHLVVVDHGPSGEMGRTGGDELNIAKKGDNLGWPNVWQCQQASGKVAPSIVWKSANPPGAVVIMKSDTIPEWKGSVLIPTLGSRQLYRVSIERKPNPIGYQVISIETYFSGEPPSGLGRIRDAVLSPKGHLYLTTSNCDGRGICPPEKDSVVRINPTFQGAF